MGIMTMRFNTRKVISVITLLAHVTPVRLITTADVPMSHPLWPKITTNRTHSFYGGSYGKYIIGQGSLRLCYLALPKSHNCKIHLLLAITNRQTNFTLSWNWSTLG